MRQVRKYYDKGNIINIISHRLYWYLSLCVQQLHIICTLYWDDNYNTQSVSPEVISSMRVLITGESRNASSIMLDDSSRILNKMSPGKFNLLKGQLIDFGITTADILKMTLLVIFLLVWQLRSNLKLLLKAQSGGIFVWKKSSIEIWNLFGPDFGGNYNITLFIVS